MILWWKRYLKLRCNLKVFLLLCSKYILENEPKKTVHQNWLCQTTQLQKLIMFKNDFKDKQKHILMKNYINYVSNNYLPVNVHQLHSLYTWLV